MNTWQDRVAHAATPWEWKDRNFWLFVTVTILVILVVIVQQFLIADGVSYAVAAVNSAFFALALGFGLRNSFRQRRKLKSAQTRDVA